MGLGHQLATSWLRWLRLGLCGDGGTLLEHGRCRAFQTLSAHGLRRTSLHGGTRAWSGFVAVAGVQGIGLPVGGAGTSV